MSGSWHEGSHLDAGLGALALVLAQRLGLVAALARGVAGAACAAVHLALGAGLFGHGGGLVGAVNGGVLRGISAIYRAIITIDEVTYGVADAVGLGFTGLDGVVALGDFVVELGAANHCDG